MAICNTCSLDKGEDFRRNRKVCRECENQMARDKRKHDKEKSKPDHIVCKQCGEEKADFRVNRAVCLDCEKKYGREYRRTTDKAKIWTEKNREKMSRLQHEWYEKSKETISAKICKRIKEEPAFRLATRSRAGIRTLLKQQGKKSKYVNCSGERLRDWFQFQFHDGMCWENYGSLWTSDHVIPIDRFLNGDQSKETVFDWLNTQPLIKKQNLTKNKHMTLEECQDHLEKAKLYLKIRKLEQSSYLQELESFCDNFAKHQVAENALESSDTTLGEKSPRGSRSMAEPDGNKSEELADPQTRT